MAAIDTKMKGKAALSLIALAGPRAANSSVEGKNAASIRDITDGHA